MLSTLLRHRGKFIILVSCMLQGCGDRFLLDQRAGDPVRGRTQAAKDHSLFTEVPWNRNFGRLAKDSDAPEKLVQLDRKAIRRLLHRAAGAGAQTEGAASRVVSISFHHQKSLNLEVERVEAVSKNVVRVVGRVYGDPRSSVMLTLENDSIVGDISWIDSERTLAIRPLGQGVHVLRASVDAAILEPDLQTAMPVIDMLVAYTPEAKRYAKGVDGIRALIHKAIADTNRAFEESGAEVRVRLVGIIETKQNEASDPSSDLGALQGKRDGLWDEVHMERSRLKADQVTLIGAYRKGATASGSGYFNATLNTAFAVVKASSISNFTLAHELGHNLGLDHSDGYENHQGRFRTIMAYGSYKRVCRFSNPALTYEGHATGDRLRDETSIINRNAARIAALM